MISAFANTFKIPELRSRILFTLLVIVIVRLGAVITLPGVDANVLADWFNEIQQRSSDDKGLTSVLALMNVFSGPKTRGIKQGAGTTQQAEQPEGERPPRGQQLGAAGRE
ncbi:MAG: hypothetical protein AAF357_13060, partial [Verrucomicrobiota bacterium]